MCKFLWDFRAVFFNFANYTGLTLTFQIVVLQKL